MDVLNFMQRTFNLRESTNGWYRFTNPFDPKARIKKDDTMAFNPDYMWVKCFRTGYSKHVAVFLSEYTKKPIKEFSHLFSQRKRQYYTDIAKVSEIDVKPLSFFDDKPLAERARKYVESRGFDPYFLDMKGFGFFNEGRYFGRIFIPYKVKGKIVYFSARSFIPSPIKYLNPPIKKSNIIFNQDALNLYDEVYIVEGVFDAMTIGDNAIAISGCTLSKQQTYTLINSQVKKFIFVPDKGFFEHTCKEALKIAFYKEIEVVDTRIDNWTDVNECKIIPKNRVNIKQIINGTKTVNSRYAG